MTNSKYSADGNQAPTGALQNIPAELFALRQWPCWDYRNGDRKVPIDPNTGNTAKVNDPSTWGTFQQAVDYQKRTGCAGIGFVFTADDPYVGIDLDDCIDPETGELTPFAQLVVDEFNTYTEVSPSGRGLKLIFKGEVPHSVRREHIEVYSERRFFTITGNRWLGALPTIENRQDKVEWLREELDIPDLSSSGHMPAEAGQITEIIAEGNRNIQLLSIAGTNRRRGMVEDEIYSLISTVNDNRCKPPLPDSEVRRIVRSVMRYQPPDERFLTELGNARQLIDRHGENMRNVKQWREWELWNGRHWIPDRTGQVMRWAKHTVRMMYAEAEAIEDQDVRRRVQAHARRSESARQLKAMVELAESEPQVAMVPEDFDDDPWTLNLANGTMDLRTGELRPHRREDYLRNMVNVEWNPDAICPTWERFLDDVFKSDQELIAYVQRTLGYAITGDVSIDRLFVLWGGGSNGKTTLIETILKILGPYGLMAARDLLLKSKWESHPTALTDLHGKRLAVTVETARGRKLNEALTKQLTGGDTIRARKMRQDFWEFSPTHKLFLVTNYKPDIGERGDAIWRRLVLIPFLAKFEGASEDPNIAQKLLAEAPGIVRWLVEGCLRWQKRGLKEPKVVKAATAEYKQEQDVFTQWLESECELGETLEEETSVLRSSYNRWTSEEVSPYEFGRLLTEANFGTSRKGDRRLRTGLRLKPMQRRMDV